MITSINKIVLCLLLSLVASSERLVANEDVAIINPAAKVAAIASRNQGVKLSDVCKAIRKAYIINDRIVDADLFFEEMHKLFVPRVREFANEKINAQMVGEFLGYIQYAHVMYPKLVSQCSRFGSFISPSYHVMLFADKLLAKVVPCLDKLPYHQETFAVEEKLIALYKQRMTKFTLPYTDSGDLQDAMIRARLGYDRLMTARITAANQFDDERSSIRREQLSILVYRELVNQRVNAIAEISSAVEKLRKHSDNISLDRCIALHKWIKTEVCGFIEKQQLGQEYVQGQAYINMIKNFSKRLDDTLAQEIAAMEKELVEDQATRKAFEKADKNSQEDESDWLSI